MNRQRIVCSNNVHEPKKEKTEPKNILNGTKEMYRNR